MLPRAHNRGIAANVGSIVYRAVVYCGLNSYRSQNAALLSASEHQGAEALRQEQHLSSPTYSCRTHRQHSRLAAFQC